MQQSLNHANGPLWKKASFARRFWQWHCARAAGAAEEPARAASLASERSALGTQQATNFIELLEGPILDLESAPLPSVLDIDLEAENILQ
jgi:hypothetical protein